MLHTFNSFPSLLGSHFVSLFSFAVCLSLFSSLAWTNIFVRVLFWVSLHVSTFPLPWSETAGETRGNERIVEREQINCIISAYKLNPRHESCGGGGSVFFFIFRREEGRDGEWKAGGIKRQTQRDRSGKMKWKAWRERSGAEVAWVRNERWWFVGKKERVMESERAGREADRCPVQVQWSGVFNLTWWTSYWKHHPPSSSFTTPTPFLTDRKPRDEAVFKVI